MTGAVGVFGKLPAQGDFVRLGLPRDFTDPWDAWWQAGLSAAQARAGEAWIAAWLQAPVWRFSLPAGCCGAAPVLGAVMPSVDRVGRYYPLTLAALSPDGWDEAFLDRAEDAGREALASDLATPAVLARLGLPPRAGRTLAAACVFQTAGGVTVAARELRSPALPDASCLIGLRDGSRADRCLGIPASVPVRRAW